MSWREEMSEGRGRRREEGGQEGIEEGRMKGKRDESTRQRSQALFCDLGSGVMTIAFKRPLPLHMNDEKMKREKDNEK